jgi:hypothetical protein
MSGDSAPSNGDWRPIEARPPACGVRHGPGPGRLDERARRLSHEELAVAHQLVTEGHDVRSLAERRGSGPTADVSVCGLPVEIKSFLSLADREGRVPSPRSVAHKVLSARRQAETAIVYTRGSGVTEPVVRAGMADLEARGGTGKVDTVRVMGDGFDLSWSRALAIERHPGLPGRPPPRPDRGPDLGL